MPRRGGSRNGGKARRSAGAARRGPVGSKGSLPLEHRVHPPAAGQGGGGWGEALDALQRMIRNLDRRTARLRGLHAGRLRCGPGCAKCCLDGLTVFEIEAERIRHGHAALLASGRPHPAGACAFLDPGGACRIYPSRPYVCRTQGLPLRWIEEGEDGTAVERRDICPENEAGTPVVELPEDACWTIGPFEDALGALQRRASGGRMTRVPLRSLFARA
jgi:Fe-S-cluster containining protein